MFSLARAASAEVGQAALRRHDLKRDATVSAQSPMAIYERHCRHGLFH